jgi:hypothetical protein
MLIRVIGVPYHILSQITTGPEDIALVVVPEFVKSIKATATNTL